MNSSKLGKHITSLFLALLIFQTMTATAAPKGKDGVSPTDPDSRPPRGKKTRTDTSAPLVSLSSPVSGSQHAEGASLVAQASASDNIGVTKVDFIFDGALKCSDSSAPYSCSFLMPSGSLGIVARAHDAAGNSKDSSVVTISSSVVTPADTTAPSVSISSPVSGSQHAEGASLVAQASASDNIGVTKVDFIFNGALKCSDSSAPYSCSFLMPSGSLGIVARAHDAAGNSKDSSVVTISSSVVTPADTTAPSVSISSPVSGSQHAEGASLVAQASASDNIGVTKVDFIFNGALKCSDSSAPYSCSFLMPSGSLGIVARAHDAAGNSKDSSVVTISSSVVQPPPTPVTGEIIDQVPSLVRDYAYPKEAHLVPLSRAPYLQQDLDAHKIIRLESGNYQTNGPRTITLKSGQQIFGLKGSGLPQVIIPAGTENAVLSRIYSSYLYFPPGDAVTRNNYFRHIEGTISVSNARLENNFFLAIDGNIQVDTQSRGYLRNNRFIRTKAHAGYPQLVMQGNTAEESYGNVFLWRNFLTPHGEASLLKNQKNVTVIGVDAENWNEKQIPGAEALFKAETMGTLLLFGVGGGTETNNSKLVESNADHNLIFGMQVAPWALANPALTFGPDAKSVSLIRGKNDDYAKSSEQTLVTKTTHGTNSVQLSVNENNNATLSSTDFSQSFESMNGVPWKKPVFAAPKGPFGGDPSTWASQPDSTAMLQKRLNEEKIVHLEPGIYYISSPLILPSHGGFIGSGRDQTIIIAKDKTFSMLFQNGDNSPSVEITLADLTLQGGKNGYEIKVQKWEGYSISSGNFISHVTFRDMAGAGFYLNYPEAESGSLDNNTFDHVNFINNRYGLRQQTGGSCTTFYCSLMDKVVFYQNQIIDNEIGMELQTQRNDHNNAWINCLFNGNKSGALKLVNNTFPIVANSVFQNNGGSPMISTNFNDLIVVSSEFSNNSAASLFPAGGLVEGNIFKASTNAFSQILIPNISSSTRTLFYNNSSEIPLGSISEGIFINNKFSKNPDLSKKFTIINQGTRTDVQSGVAAPKPQLLISQ